MPSMRSGVFMVSALCLALVLSVGCARKQAEVAQVVKEKRTAEISEVKDVVDQLLAMPFGKGTASIPGLKRYMAAGSREYYYTPATDSAEARRSREPNMVYAFEGGRLVGAIASIAHVRDFSYALNYLEERFGRSTMQREGKALVYLFSPKGKKIKVKVDEPTGRMKIGVYAKGDAETEPVPAKQ